MFRGHPERSRGGPAKPRRPSEAEAAQRSRGGPAKPIPKYLETLQTTLSLAFYSDYTYFYHFIMFPIHIYIYGYVQLLLHTLRVKPRLSQSRGPVEREREREYYSLGVSKSMRLLFHATDRIEPCVHTRFPSFGWGRMTLSISRRG
jgi:hypothetical protein